MPRRLSEELTRKEMIDPQLEKAGWFLRDHSKVKIEIPAGGYDAEPWKGVSDYCLYRESGKGLAVVDAKRTTHDARLAEAQLTHYVAEIEKHQSDKPHVQKCIPEELMILLLSAATSCSPKAERKWRTG
jgi:type I site-specific restriction endonuclease